MQINIPKRSELFIKCISGIIFLILLNSCQAPKPVDCVDLKIGFFPGKNYDLLTERSSDITIQYFGSAKPMKKLKEMGIRNPTQIIKKFCTQAVLSANKPNEDESFGVSLKIAKPLGRVGVSEIPEGLIFKGVCNPKKYPELDVVESDTIDYSWKKKLLKSVENIFFQFAFPDQSLKIGDQFSVEKPLSMPMEGSTIEMLVITNYKLTGIAEGVAKFELTQKFEMKPTILNNSFKGTGKGIGLMEYDVDKLLILNYKIDSEMDLVKKLDNFEFVLKSKSTFWQTNKLALN